jgi:DinB superfamily
LRVNLNLDRVSPLYITRSVLVPGEIRMSGPSTLIEGYLEGSAKLRRAVSELSFEQLVARPVPGRWSTMEVVCHLVDSEQAWCHRMKRVIAEEKPLLIGYDETRFTTALAYHDRDLEQELSLLEGMRQQMARILQTVPEAAWSYSGVHSERGLITLEEMLRAETEHIPHHLSFIMEKRKALGLGPVPE